MKTADYHSGEITMDTHEHIYDRQIGENQMGCGYCIDNNMQYTPKQLDNHNLNAGNPGNDGGRPTKYKSEYCQMIIDHMKQGYSMESFGAIAECSKDTLYEWMQVHTEFSDAVNQGRMHSLRFWEALGIQVVAGKIEKTNASIYALHMANKHKWVSSRQDVTSGDEKIDTKTVIMLPTKLKIEETTPQEIENHE